MHGDRPIITQDSKEGESFEKNHEITQGIVGGIIWSVFIFSLCAREIIMRSAKSTDGYYIYYII